MPKKYLSIVIIVAALIIGFNIWYLTRSPKAPQKETITQTKEETGAQTKEGNKQFEANAVSYTDNGFVPSSLKIKPKETVTFKNDSSLPLWVASGSHPSHTQYPITGGCIASAFDSCKNIKQGEAWSFKFDIVGDWKYHNHLNSADEGTVIVE